MDLKFNIMIKSAETEDAHRTTTDFAVSTQFFNPPILSVGAARPYHWKIKYTPEQAICVWKMSST